MNSFDVDVPRKPGRVQSFSVIVIWFFFNISMGSSTKWLYLYGAVCFEESGTCTTFKYPVAVTVVHMVFSWLICSVILWFRARNNTPNEDGSKLLRFSFRQQLVKIAPLALVFSASVGMGNLSLKYIYPSFNQMLASVSPLITVLISIIMYRKRYNQWTWLSMPIICGGLLVCSSTEVNFNAVGVAFVVGATILRALKSVMQEKLLDPSEQTLDSVSLLYYIAPWAGAILLCMSLVLEGSDPIMLLLPSQSPKTGAGFVTALLMFSGINACFLNISGNLVTAYTGAVMLQILGNVKACFAIIVSTAIFQNPVTLSQACGVAMCLAGVWLYQRKGGVFSSKT